jgi:hypothetical protein
MSFEAHPVSSTYKPAEDSSIQDKLVNGSSKLKENRPTKADEEGTTGKRANLHCIQLSWSSMNDSRRGGTGQGQGRKRHSFAVADESMEMMSQLSNTQ